MMRKVLVTGGGGFIGSWITDRLREEGIEVLLFDHSAPGFLKVEPEDGIEFFHGDVMNDVSVVEAAAHVDGIVHLAAVLGTQETIKNPIPSAKTNILGALNVFEAANQYDLPVVYAGVGNHWMREYGAGSYTISKTAAEDYARMFTQFRGGKISIVRPVNAYGPRQSVAAPFGTSKVRKIMPSFICHALAGLDIEVYGDGTQVSDCVYVQDVADVFVRTLLKTEAHPLTNVVEVGPLSSVNVNYVATLVADTVARLTGRQPVSLRHLPMRPGEVPNAKVSAGLTGLTELGVDSGYFVSLETGVERTVRWYIENWLPTWEAQR